MKRLIIASSIMIALIFITSCTGPNGNAYQKYWWTGSLGYIYDTNPSTPATIYNDVYFPTSSGSYYMEYEAGNGSKWYLYYTITTKEGTLFNTAGDDTWFEIWLLSTGPSLYKWDSARNIQNDDAIAKGVSTSISINEANERISTGKVLSEILGADEREYIYGSIKIEWGRILEE